MPEWAHTEREKERWGEERERDNEMKREKEVKYIEKRRL